MSCTRTVKTFEDVTVTIDTCSKIELELIEKSIITAIIQKLEKLNILIKNANVYAYNGALLINDRYNTCYDIMNVVEAFGLDIKQIQCGLRGKNYIITDKLLNVLKQFGVNYDFGCNVSNQELSDSIMKIISENTDEIVVDNEILEAVKNIKTNGHYTTTKSRVVTKTYYDGYLVDNKYGEWDVSNVDTAMDKVKKISKYAEENVNKANAQLRDGTAKLIYARARQMGYAVQEIKKGNQTQLVLVRCE